MLSIGKIDSEHYYVALTDPARADLYHAEAGHSPGTWFGRPPETFRVSGGTVRADELANLLRGVSAEGSTRLAGSGRGGRRPGLDLTFSPPKTFSAACAVADPELRRELEIIHEAAVDAAVQYFQDNLAFTRRGKRGCRLEGVGGVGAAKFTHRTSRENQPQLHTHVLLLNLCERADGTTGALDLSFAYRHQWVLDDLYRLHLTNELERRLGMETFRPREGVPRGAAEPPGVKPWFEVAGVPEALADLWSERRKQIVAEVRAKGMEGSSRAKELAAKTTRKPKDTATPSAELESLWREQARAHGFGPSQLRQLLRRTRSRSQGLGDRVEAAVQAALCELNESHAHFSKHDLVQRAARHAQCQAVPAPLLAAAIAHRLDHSPEFIRRGTERGLARYTTAVNYEKEKTLLALAEDFRKRPGPGVAESTLRKVLSSPEFATISGEQRRAVEHITAREGGAIKVVSGMAGTGKTFALNAARQALEQAGFKVIGAAYTGRAAAQLRRDAHIETATLHRTLADLESTVLDSAKQHARGLVRAAMGKSTRTRRKVTLDASTCLIVDEAGMVGTDQLLRVLERAHAAGAAVVLVGDERQVQPIAAGGPFKSLAERLGHVSLKNITRQRLHAEDREPDWARKAVHAFARGDSRAGFEAFASRGLLTLAEDGKAAREALIRDWKANGGAENPASHVILASTRADVAVLNRMAQEARLQAGRLGGVRVELSRGAGLFVGVPQVTVGGDTILEGDRVLLSRNSAFYDVQNGNLGTVLRVDPIRRLLKVRVDGRKDPVTLALDDYNRYGQAVHLGYAVTTHKAQGASFEYAYVMAGADRELTYVQASRAKALTRFYGTDLDGAGLETLARAAARSHQKDLFHEVPGPERAKGRGTIFQEMTR